MKKIFLTFSAIAWVFFAFAQPPDFFNYQAVVRDADGKIVASQDVSFKIEILSGSGSGTVVYREIHLATTSDQGLVNLKIFGGTVDGTWSVIDWSADDHFIKVYLGNSTGTDFIEMGTSQLLSVPYALCAKSIGSDKLPVEMTSIQVTDTLKIGSDGIGIGEITDLTGTTDATLNYVTVNLPAGYTGFRTRVLSLVIYSSNIFVFSKSYYGLGYTSTGGTIGYKLYSSTSPIPSNTLTIYYPDDLKSHTFRATLMQIK
ncbi:MAG: hypothetical protein JW973_07410 [Bacteroidales bacterium]|nr:hypothetical protein [Bacteroidales bacterium]